MTFTFEIIFWLSVFLILHSYVFYPFILSILPKKQKFESFDYNSDLPKVSILISIYNEELVIEEKIKSILDSEYPKDKIEIIIGSDCSDDNSNIIVEKFTKKYDFIKLFAFTQRQGKPSVINKIYKHANGQIIILTDANVMFKKNTIFELVRYFKDETVGLVDTKMTNKGIVKDGISFQESTYISREVKIKYNESRIWGTMMGPFGGCYAIRKNLFKPVPPNFLVDDFYINMKILEQNYKTINNLNAEVFEDVSNNLNDEFKRKVRIATGNFQNTKTFNHLLFRWLHNKKNKRNISQFGMAFCFFSHKILRWFVPFLIVIIAISGLFLIHIKFYLILYLGFVTLLILPIIDLLLKKININISIIRFITHFIVMNIALSIGFFRFLKGVKSGVWKPTKRNQAEN